MRKTVCLVTATLALAGATAAQAQSVTASVQIPTVLSIDVAGPNTFSFPAVTAADYAADGTGSVLAGAANNSTLSTRGNVSHDVEIASSGGATEMSYTGAETAPSVKPVGHLRWSLDGSTWNPLQGVAQDVQTAVARGAHQDLATVQYQMLLDLATDSPGTYSVTFVYSVVPN